MRVEAEEERLRAAAEEEVRREAEARVRKLKEWRLRAEAEAEARDEQDARDRVEAEARERTTTAELEVQRERLEMPLKQDGIERQDAEVEKREEEICHRSATIPSDKAGDSVRTTPNRKKHGKNTGSDEQRREREKQKERKKVKREGQKAATTDAITQKPEATSVPQPRASGKRVQPVVSFRIIRVLSFR
jgi:hypothetical protein